MNCLNCGVEVPQTKGKRAKQFCNPKCRMEYWKKKKSEIRKEPDLSFLDIQKPQESPDRFLAEMEETFKIGGTPKNDKSEEKDGLALESYQLSSLRLQVDVLQSELTKLRSENDGLKMALESLKKASVVKIAFEPVETTQKEYNPNENPRFKSKNGLK